MASLINLATVLRAGQVYAHHAHNVCSGPQFFEDHAFFGDVYGKYESDYDDVIERHIGSTGDRPNTIELMGRALELVQDLGDDYFQGILIIDKSICSICKSMCDSGEYSEGTKQLIGEICNQAEMRKYKIVQRTARD